MSSNYIRKRESRAEHGASRDLSFPPLPEPIVAGIYDNHAHLEIIDGDDPIDHLEQLDRAAAVGVRGVIQVGGDLESSRWSVQLADSDPRVLAAVAIHPNEAPAYEAAGTLDGAIAEIDELAAHPRVVAIGETGLDFFRTGASGLDAQYRSFEQHIAIAKRRDLAMQIHDRDAHDEVIATLGRVGAPERTVFHCFSGDAAMARIAAEEGWYLSFAGTVTFKNAANLREALAVIPRERILVETDSPFLTPTPYRGRPNSPYLVLHTLRFIAELLGVDDEQLAAEVSANTERVYGAW